MLNKMKMILDLDTGIDDALALAYAVASEEVELIGVTTTYGNVLLEQGADNVLKLLALLGVPEVPVFNGLPHASAKTDFAVQPISAQIHGKNGIGEVALGAPQGQVQAQSAIDFILEAVQTYGSDLTIVAAGPMTNLDAAIAKDLNAMAGVGKIVIMGGALTVCGNVTPFAEANIRQDPAAADRLFRSGLPITMVGLDVTLRTLLQYKETEQWRDLGTEAGKKFADIVDYYIKAYEVTSPRLKGCALHDPLAVAVAIQPGLLETIQLHMKVETEGPSTGRTIGDNERINEPHPNVAVGVNVDVATFLHEFMTRTLALFARQQ